jgi:hypothetical protein
LQYVCKNVLQFLETEEYIIGIGPSSPQNLFAYHDLDSTPNHGNFSKTFQNHQNDYVTENPTWSHGNGTEMMDTINYLASKGVTMITMTTLTTNGPDKNVFALTTTSSPKVYYDVSKFAQWGIVFDYTERKGMALRMKLHDSDSLDFFDTTAEMKIYYREMMARFGHHLGIIWDIGENMADLDEIRFRSHYIRSIDTHIIVRL